ncbi:MAG: hypothetical protein QMC67_17515 [Candidatus Wallbacteria bacterium]
MDMQKLIGLISDSSAKIKIEGLKAVEGITNWNEYSSSEIMQLFEILNENINYPRADVRTHVELAHAKVKEILTGVMKNNPMDFASLSAELVASDDTPASNGDKKNKPSAGASDQSLAKQLKQHASDTLVNTSADIMSKIPLKNQEAPKFKQPISEAFENPKANLSSDLEVSDESEAPPKTPSAKEKTAASYKAKPKPQMLVVFASEETRIKKFFLTLVSIIIFALFLGLAYPQIMQNTSAGKAAMGLGGVYLLFLFFPISYISSASKIRLALISLIGLVFFMTFTSGFNVDFQITEKLKSFNLFPDKFNVNEFIVKSSLLLSFIFTIIFFLADDHIGTGYRIFLFILGVYSSVTLAENFISTAGIKEIFLERGGIGEKFPFPIPYLKPFYFGANIFMPLCLITFAFEFLSDLFDFSFRKLFYSFTGIIFTLMICSYIFYNLNQLSVVSLVNAFIQPNINIEKISTDEFYDSVHRSMLQKGDIKDMVLDRLRIEKVEIFAHDENVKENSQPEKILPGPLRNPAVSPNGLYLAYVVNDGKKSDIMLYNLKTRGETIALASDGSFNDFPAFSAASDKLAYVSNKSGADNIYIMKITSREVKQVTNTTTPKSHLMWAPQRNAITYLDNGSLIKQPVELDTAYDKRDPKEKIKLLQSISEKIAGVKINCEISSLTPNQLSMRYKTNLNNLGDVFQEIGTIMIIATKLFEDNDGIEKFTATITYFNEKIEITSIPAIVKQNIDDVKFVNKDKIKTWLKNSTVYVNDKLRQFD